MALIWGVGGTVDEDGRAMFSQCLRGFLKGECNCETPHFVAALRLVSEQNSQRLRGFLKGECKCETLHFLAAPRLVSKKKGMLHR